MKKLISLFIAITLVLSCFSLAACNNGDDDPNSDRPITINLAISDDGTGRDWYNYLETAYEAYNTQVNVKLQNRDSQLSNKDRAVTMLPDDVAAMSFSNYSEYGSYLMDITDIFTGKAYDDDYNYVGIGNATATKSIFDRLSEDERKLYAVSENGNTVYKLIPWYSNLFGLWYDYDFYTEQGLQAFDGYKGLDLIDGNDDDLWGADGVEGTYDDGLPATWADFKAMLSYLKTNGKSTTPFTWSYTEKWMQTYTLDQIIASYNQRNDYALHYTFNGTHSVVGEITPATGYKLYTEEARMGHKAALAFCDFVDSNKLYSAGSIDSTQTHLVAQNDFLNSVTTEYEGTRSMFIMEGSWWQYEAREYMEEMAEFVDPMYGYGERNFAFFPFPKFMGEDGITPQDVTDKNVAPVYPNSALVPLKTDASPEKVAAVKDFLLFAMSNTSLTKFVEFNNMPPTVDFKYDKDNNNFDFMTLSQLNFLSEQTTEQVYMHNAAKLSTTASVRENNTGFFSNWDWGAKIDDGHGEYLEMGSPLERMCLSTKVGKNEYWTGLFKYAATMYDQDSWSIS